MLLPYPPQNPHEASLALHTDFYQLTMAYGYWKRGLADREAVFHLFFRKKPFQGSFAIAAGLDTALTFLEKFYYSASDLAYLEQIKTPCGASLFEGAFLDYLSRLKLTCSLDAVPEGSVVFPYEPMLRVQGPLIQAQLMESPLLNLINFQTLIATKAARICFAAAPDPVVEFGLRRAQGFNGALAASRAAFIGGCSATSNLLAGKEYGIPVSGTHAHSWIMTFEDEEEAFSSYAQTFPSQCILLIDTYHTMSAVKKAIRVGLRLREQGKELVGVRIDSGDLAHLSIEIRQLLDEAGLQNTQILASNELDETLIKDLKQQGAKITMWGVGTNLVTGKEQPALDGVYKLSLLRTERGEWEDKLKVSEQLAKVSNPGIHQVRRYFNGSGNVADLIYDVRYPLSRSPVSIDPFDPTRRHLLDARLDYVDLLIPVMREGKRCFTSPPLDQVRDRTLSELARFHPAIRRFLYPQPYPVGLEESVYEKRCALVQRLGAV